MPRSLIICSGCKGGVGKSMVTMCIVDYFAHEKKRSILLIDGDAANPDVYRQYDKSKPNGDEESCDSGNPHAGKEGVSRKMIPLGDEEEEWTDLVEECENAADSDVIVSTPAGHVQRLVQADTYFSAAVEELNRRAVLLWVINGQRDCVELLRQYLDNRPSNAVTVHVVRNAGLARRFDLFNNTNTAQMVTNAGGKIITLPKIVRQVTDRMYSGRRETLREIAEGRSIPVAERAAARRFRRCVWPLLDDLGLTDE